MRKQITSGTIALADLLLPAAKKQSRVVHAQEDDLIKDKIIAAIGIYEDYTGIALSESTYKMGLDECPKNRIIFITPCPLKSVTSIKFYDSMGALQTMEDTNYVIDDLSEPARIELRIAPMTEKRINAVQIEYVCGKNYTADNLPGKAKAAIMMLAGHMYENREEVVTGTIVSKVPMAAQDLMDFDRIKQF